VGHGRVTGGLHRKTQEELAPDDGTADASTIAENEGQEDLAPDNSTDAPTMRPPIRRAQPRQPNQAARPKHGRSANVPANLRHRTHPFPIAPKPQHFPPAFPPRISGTISPTISPRISGTISAGF